MKKKIFWMAVFTLFTMLMTGIYLAARQQSKSKPSSTAPVLKVPSVMAVRMRVHDDGDRYDDNDHCIYFDPKPSSMPSPTPTPTPLKVEVDLSEDPKADLTMNINMFYSNPNGKLASEYLPGKCKYDNQHPTTCTATFYEITESQSHNSRPKLVPPWHLGDYPDGTYLADGSLSTTTVAATSVNAKKVPGLPDGHFLYVFRNPKPPCQ